MYVEEIFLTDFRNFERVDLKFDPAINIFLGKNAQGKTNILEAIHLAALGKSRAAADFELIRWDCPSALVKLKFFKTEIEHNLAFELTTGKRRKILFDANSIRPRDLVGKLNSVMFSPEDLFMFKNSPVNRRRFLDGEISQASPVYFSDISAYGRLVDQRNNLLKKIREGFARPDDLDLWTEQLAGVAAKIVIKRLNTIYKLNFLANLMQRKISSQVENLTVEYDFHGLEDFDREKFKNIGIDPENLQNFPGEEIVEKAAVLYHEILKARKFSDIKRGSTSLGPHIDDLKFFVNGRELRLFGSQGQMRTVALALKLSELQFLKSETGEYPILLLDDVMSELDSERREQLLIFLRREKIQTLITATDAAYFPSLYFGKIFKVSAGEITETI